MDAHPSPPPGPRPFWVPPGVTFDQLPQALQHAIVEIVNPIYEAYVLGAESPLEKGQGLSYVQLLWWEILGHLDLAEDWASNLPYGGNDKGQRARLRRQLSLVSLKDKVAKFLLEVQKFNTKMGANDPLRRRPR